MTHPDLVRGTEVAILIEEGEDDRRPGVTKPYLLVDPGKTGGRRAVYLYEPAAGFQPLLLERLSARP